MRKWLKDVWPLIVFSACGYSFCIGVLVFAILSSGCSKKVQNTPEVLPHEDAQVIMRLEGEPTQEQPPAPEEGSFDFSKPANITVYFQYNSDNLEQTELDKLEPLLGRDYELNIAGYTCTIGSSGYNLGLGLARANAVKTYLGRGNVTSYGEESCHANCESINELDCEMCRKVEIVVK